MGNDHTVVALMVEQFVDALGQFEPHQVVHVLRTHIAELFATHVGHIENLWHSLDERLHTHLAGAIGRVGGRLADASDGSARGDDSDLGFRIATDAHHEGQQQQHEIEFLGLHDGLFLIDIFVDCENLAYTDRHSKSSVMR